LIDVLFGMTANLKDFLHPSHTNVKRKPLKQMDAKKNNYLQVGYSPDGL
jgi:hypothetical protein